MRTLNLGVVAVVLLELTSVCSAVGDVSFLDEVPLSNTTPVANATTPGDEGSGSGSEFHCDLSEFAENMCLEDLDGNFFGVLLEVFLFFFCFLALAIVCDDYLVLSLETLCLRWKIRDDIAGCTFMAFGSAAPEIIVNAVATLKAAEGSTDLGISAIIGSGMIAFMLIPGFCGIFGGVPKPLQLKRRPLARDVIAYSIGLIELCVFFHDGDIHTGEAGIMLGTYAMYIVVVIVSPRIRARFRKNKVVESTPLLPGSIQEDRKIRTLGNVTFYTKQGEECTFYTTGSRLVTLNGNEVGGEGTDTVKFILGDQYVINVGGVDISLDAKGCERVIAKVVRVLETREVPIVQEWKVGSKVVAWHEEQNRFLEASVVGRSEEDGSYTVRWTDATDSSGLPFSDLRPDAASADASFTDKIDTLEESRQKRSDALKYAHTIGALDDKSYNIAIQELDEKMVPQADDDDSDYSDGSTGYTAISMWRHQWWREDSGPPSRFEAYLKPFMVFVRFWQFVFKYTIPAYEGPGEEQQIEPEEEKEEVWYREKLYPITFVVSFIWVAVFSFIISNIASRWADKSGLGTGFMGLLMISLGAEIPDCIQSVTVAKRGYGSMAVSNAVGSQNVNIFIGLGLPWLISNLAKGETIKVDKVSDLQAAAYFQGGGVCLNLTLLLGLAYWQGKNKASLGLDKGKALVAAYVVVIATFAIYSQA